MRKLFLILSICCVELVYSPQVRADFELVQNVINGIGKIQAKEQKTQVEAQKEESLEQKEAQGPSGKMKGITTKTNKLKRFAAKAKKNVDKVKTDLGNVATDVGKLKEQADAAKTTLGTVAGKLDDIKGYVPFGQDQIGSLQSVVSGATSGLGTATEKMGDAHKTLSKVSGKSEDEQLQNSQAGSNDGKSASSPKGDENAENENNPDLQDVTTKTERKKFSLPSIGNIFSSKKKTASEDTDSQESKEDKSSQEQNSAPKEEEGKTSLWLQPEGNDRILHSYVYHQQKMVFAKLSFGGDDTYENEKNAEFNADDGASRQPENISKALESDSGSELEKSIKNTVSSPSADAGEQSVTSQKAEEDNNEILRQYLAQIYAYALALRVNLAEVRENEDENPKDAEDVRTATTLLKEETAKTVDYLNRFVAMEAALLELKTRIGLRTVIAEDGNESEEK